MDGDRRDVPGVGCARLLLPFMRVELVVSCLMEEIGLTKAQAADAVRAVDPDCARCQCGRDGSTGECERAVTSSDPQPGTAPATG